MICKKCGSENHETAKFCRNCGNQLQQKDTTNVPLNQNKQNYKKKTGKKWGVLLVLTVVIAGVIAGFWITKNKNEKKIKEYKNQIAQGNKYVEDLDYEKAEESYLKAIKIDPKRKKPYLKLADIYVAQEKYDKAVKILEDASKNVTVTEKKGEDKQNISEVKQEIETKKEEISNASEYTWVVKPKIEADDIYYLRGKDEFSHSENEMQKQLLNRYAVIKTGDTYGLIGMDGKWYKDLKCTEVGVVLDYYNLKTKDSIYSTEYETETNDFYVDENDELKETVAMYGSDYGRCVIAFTDGNDNYSDCSVTDVVNVANRYHVPVFIIGIGSVDTTDLYTITNQTGGEYYNINAVNSMQEIYEKIYRMEKQLYMVEFEDGTGADINDQSDIKTGYKSVKYGGECNYTYTPNVLLSAGSATLYKDGPEAVVEEYLKNFDDAVNHSDFSLISNCLQKGSPIYTEQEKYVQRDISEQLDSYELTDVSYSDENNCVISTRETYYVQVSGEALQLMTQECKYSLVKENGNWFMTSFVDINVVSRIKQ